MWTTSYHDCYVLEGDQARFYINITQLLVNHLLAFDFDIDQEDNVAFTGCVPFDKSSIRQKMDLLSLCLEALLEPEVETPEPTHLMEAAAYFPFAFLEEQVLTEIEQERLNGDQISEDEQFYSKYYRRHTFDQYQKSSLSQIDRELATEENSDPKPLHLESHDEEHWRQVIHFLAHELVLGNDEDFRLTGYLPQILDDTGSITQSMGIGENYFELRLPSVTEQDYEQALARIHRY